jgi:hypothetical protein
MNKTLLTAALAALSLTVALPAGATPERRIVNYDELMVLVPGLEELGYSRITTVEHCAEVTEVTDWMELTTDSEFETMEACLIEHT